MLVGVGPGTLVTPLGRVPYVMLMGYAVVPEVASARANVSSVLRMPLSVPKTRFPLVRAVADPCAEGGVLKLR